MVLSAVIFGNRAIKAQEEAGQPTSRMAAAGIGFGYFGLGCVLLLLFFVCGGLWLIGHLLTV